MALLYPTTQSAAVSEVRAIINEPTASFWNDTEIQNWLKLGCIELSTKGLCYEVLGTITLASGTFLYGTFACLGSSNITIANAVVKIYSAVVVVSSAYRGLRQIHPRMLGNVLDGASTGPLKYFYRWGGKFAIHPAGCVSGSKVILHFSRKTDDVTLIPDEWRFLACKYAAARCWEKAGRANLAQFYDQQFAIGLNYQKAELMARNADSTDMMKLPDRTQIVSPSG